jgi:putative hemolysin
LSIGSGGLQRNYFAVLAADTTGTAARLVLAAVGAIADNFASCPPAPTPPRLVPSVETTIEVVIILALILLNGYFAGAEIAVLTARRGRLELAAQQGNAGAQAALKLLGDTSGFLSTVQVGITGVGTFAAAYSGANLVDDLAGWLATANVPVIAQNGEAIALVIVTGTLVFVSLVLGELVPKRLALAWAEQLAQFVALPMRLLSIVARPFVVVLGFVSNIVLRLCGVGADQVVQVSVDDIHHLLKTGQEQGVLASTQHEVAIEALQLRNRRARDIMRPRMDIDAIDIDTPSDEVVGAVAMSGFSRLPVYDDNLDHVIGFVYNKDVLLQAHLRRPIELRKMLREPLFIPESLPLDRLLQLFQQRRTQLALVLDEFGGTRGMVTFEDVLEELVGEIYDEHRLADEQKIVVRDDGSLLVDGQLPVHDLVDHLPPQARLADSTREWSTVAGLVMSGLSELPKIADKVTSGDVDFEVVDMEGQRIDRVLVSWTTPASDTGESG